jgi:hypothetical protein
MSWILDNPNVVYIPLGMIALGFVTAFWLTKRVKFLALAGGVVLGIGLFWLLTWLIVTDSRQIQLNVQAMADAAVAKDTAGLEKHLARDFRYKQLDRDKVAERARQTIDQWKIHEIKVWEYNTLEGPANGRAKVRFKLTVFSSVLDRPTVVLGIAEFVQENQQWKMRTIDIRDPLHREQSMPGAP